MYAIFPYPEAWTLESTSTVLLCCIPSLLCLTMFLSFTLIAHSLLMKIDTDSKYINSLYRCMCLIIYLFIFAILLSCVCCVSSFYIVFFAKKWLHLFVCVYQFFLRNDMRRFCAMFFISFSALFIWNFKFVMPIHFLSFALRYVCSVN